jgi:hypothetical protein
VLEDLGIKAIHGFSLGYGAIEAMTLGRCGVGAGGGPLVKVMLISGTMAQGCSQMLQIAQKLIWIVDGSLRSPKGWWSQPQ